MIRLKEARLCIDCEMIHTGNRCPACGSEYWHYIVNWVESRLPEARAYRRQINLILRDENERR